MNSNKKLIDYFQLIYNDVDCVIFKVKNDSDTSSLNLQLLKTGCFYGDERYIRISKRHKTEVTYSIITIKDQVREFSQYIKNNADIIRQISMIKYMTLFDYGVIIKIPYIFNLNII